MIESPVLQLERLVIFPPKANKQKEVEEGEGPEFQGLIALEKGEGALQRPRKSTRINQSIDAENSDILKSTAHKKLD